jgi:hypothetical protein
MPNAPPLEIKENLIIKLITVFPLFRIDEAQPCTNSI